MTQSTPGPLKRTPLRDRHRELGAKFGPFGGWDMPIEYADGGVMREHAAVREAVGIFDVSHLGKVSVRGAGAAAHVNAVLTNDLARIGPGRAQYTLCCTEAGGVVDDLIAYLRGPDEVFLVPNAVGAASVAAALAEGAPTPIAVRDQHADYGTIAVQGPRSAELLDRLGLPSELAYMAFTDTAWEGRQLTVCRTGYTGEHGYELLPPSEVTPALWDALLAAGADLGARPCGLGARDTLRTEMGYPLHGQDLSVDVTPVQARIGWAVGWSKPAFRGRDALAEERATGPARRLWGLESTDRGIPRPHMAVTDPSGAPLGTVTSGTFSPTRRLGIGLALLDAAVEVGADVHVDVRGHPSVMRVVRPPFVPSRPT